LRLRDLERTCLQRPRIWLVWARTQFIGLNGPRHGVQLQAGTAPRLQDNSRGRFRWDSRTRLSDPSPDFDGSVGSATSGSTSMSLMVHARRPVKTGCASDSRHARDLSAVPSDKGLYAPPRSRSALVRDPAALRAAPLLLHPALYHFGRRGRELLPEWVHKYSRGFGPRRVGSRCSRGEQLPTARWIHDDMASLGSSTAGEHQRLEALPNNLASPREIRSPARKE